MWRRAYDPAPCGDVPGNSSRSSGTWEEGIPRVISAGPGIRSSLVPSLRGRSPGRGRARAPASPLPAAVGRDPDVRARGRPAPTTGALPEEAADRCAGGSSSWRARSSPASPSGSRSASSRPAAGRAGSRAAASSPGTPTWDGPFPRSRDVALYLDCRGSGSPTVVLEAGIGSDARSWGSVFPALARETRTCAYSRANRWGSDPRDTHTVAEAVADLRAALAAAGERPPFVLVGHSLGDVYVRVFAGQHPGAVGGAGPRRSVRPGPLPAPDRAGLAGPRPRLAGRPRSQHRGRAGNRAAGLARVGG